MLEQTVEPHIFIVLGATGDLTRRKLLPALYHLRDQSTVEKPNRLIVGAALPVAPSKSRADSDWV